MTTIVNGVSVEHRDKWRNIKSIEKKWNLTSETLRSQSKGIKYVCTMKYTAKETERMNATKSMTVDVAGRQK